MLDKVRSALERFAAWKYAATVVVVFGGALVAPSIGSGLAADDWFHRLVLTGSNAVGGVHHRPLDLFVFSDGNPAVGRAQQESGLIGWWADPGAALAYFRPLSAATHWLDYRLWPNAPWAMHVHSLVWFVLGLVALSRVYRRFAEPAWVAILALLLYAVDDAHGFVVSWIANRNALITLALGLPVLVLHDRGRRQGAASSRWFATALFFVALFAGESAVAVGGYLVAYAAFLEPGPWKRRAASLLPYMVAFVVWRVIYAGLGYGTHGSGLAIDPIHEPVAFIHALAVRLPILLVAQFALPPSDLWEVFQTIAPWLPTVVYVGALVLLASIAWTLAPLMRREPAVRFWALGTLLAALPACSQVPSDRLLLYTGVGAQALVARFLAAVLRREPWTKSSTLASVGTGAVAALFVVLHLVIAPLWLPLRSRGPADVDSMLSLADRTLPRDPAVARKTVVLVNPPADAFAGYVMMKRAATGVVRPGRLRWLATGASDMVVERLDTRSLRVELKDGFLSLASERMQRSSGNPMLVGYTVSLSGMTVRVTKVTADLRPKEIIATFDAPLEDPGLVFLKWTAKGYAPFAIPAIGAHVELPALDFTTLRM